MAILNFWENAPFYFTVEFEEGKAVDGATTAELLERVDRVSSSKGMVRISSNSWQVFCETKQARFRILESTLTELSRSRWFMESVGVWLAFDDESPWGEDMIAMSKEIPLEFIA